MGLLFLVILCRRINCVRSLKQKYVRACVRACICMRACMRACVHTSILIYNSVLMSTRYPEKRREYATHRYEICSEDSYRPYINNIWLEF